LLQGVQIRPANILFDKSYRLDLGGGVKVSLSWFGAAHTKGDELVMVEPDSVLYSGDVVQNKAGPYFYCAECTPGKWLNVLDHVAQLHPKIVVPDHSPSGDGSLIASERAFILELQTRASALKKEGKSEAEAERILTPEIEAKYQGWSGLNHIQDAVARAYAQAGAP
jgi:glyoxylase-like metal-dependent hydrolase (beta-lactamase superfamily II)